MWQKIETVPIDETPVLLYEKAYGHAVAGICDEAGCYMLTANDGYYFINPSHWMPLPKPPHEIESISK